MCWMTKLGAAVVSRETCPLWVSGLAAASSCTDDQAVQFERAEDRFAFGTASSASVREGLCSDARERVACVLVEARTLDAMIGALG